MELSDEQWAFLREHHSAVMITLRPDGSPHAVRMAVAVVEGKIWSSGVPSRLRTQHLRRDSRCTLFVFDPGWSWLTLESTVTIREGPELPDMSLRLFQEMQKDRQLAPGRILWNGVERSYHEFLQIMKDEQRLIYEFVPRRVYGMI